MHDAAVGDRLAVAGHGVDGHRGEGGGDLLARVLARGVDRADDRRDRGTGGDGVGEHGAAAGEPEAAVVERDGEAGAERLHTERVLRHLEQPRLDVRDADVAGQDVRDPRGEAEGEGSREQEATRATIERLTWPSLPLPPPLTHPIRVSGPGTLAPCGSNDPWGHHPGDDQPQPAAPLRPLARAQPWRLRRSGPAPVVVDLGYGTSPVTALELHDRLRRVRPDVEVVGIEIDPARVAAAAPLERPGLRFAVGEFEVPLPGGARPVVSGCPTRTSPTGPMGSRRP